MILEGVVTTQDISGQLNIAPMGPIVEPDMRVLRLRPFQTSQTYQNLKATGCGVLHVVDDVLLIAKAVCRQLEPEPKTQPAVDIAGRVLTSACRWFEFRIDSIDDSEQRTECLATVIHTGRLRDFFGFNRAKHAVLEAAIMATRTHILERDEVVCEFERLRVPVQKTAGPDERAAFNLIMDFVNQQYETNLCAKL
ncbi:MAG: DUF447 domain-containing protein [Planctomycetaceae bacterium]